MFKIKVICQTIKFLTKYLNEVIYKAKNNNFILLITSSTSGWFKNAA